MKVEIRQSFEKDALKLPAKVQLQVAFLVATLEEADRVTSLKSCKKLTGFKSAYRLRLGNYRVGFFFENNTIELVRILSRKEIYRYFP